MLEKLDSVGWAGLTHAYGTAEEIPAFIAALRSSDPEIRAAALDELWSSLLHEGRRYEADVYTVPFLADLALDPDTADRPEILRLLTAMAIGSDHPYLVTGFPIEQLRPSPDAVDESWHLLYGEWSGGRSPSADPLQVDELRVYDAVRAEVPRVLRLLVVEDDAVVEAAAYLLAWFPEHARASVGSLLELAATPSRGRDLRVSALLAAGLAGRGPLPELAEGLVLLSAADGEVRWAAAAAWALTTGPGTPEEVRSVLRERAAAGVLPGEPCLAPWGEQRAAWSARLLEHIGDPSAQALRGDWVAAAVARPRAGSWHDHYAESFYLAYGEHEPRPVPFAALTGPQRGLVEHLVRHPDALVAEPEDMPELLRRHALPDSHPGLSAYAAGH